MFMYNLLRRLFSTTGMPLILLISPAGTLAQDWPHSTKDELLDSVTVTGERPALNTSTTITTLSGDRRSEEHTSELQSLMRISYAVFCSIKKILTTRRHTNKATHNIINTHTYNNHSQT